MDTAQAGLGCLAVTRAPSTAPIDSSAAPATGGVENIRRVLVLAVAPAQVLDLAGPMEVFSQADRLRPSGSGQRVGEANAPAAPRYCPELVMVGAPVEGGPTTTCGLTMVGARSPAEALADPAPLDTLLVAGGEGARRRCQEAGLRDAVAGLAARARRVVGVCTGAFPLAAAGLLDGRRAVTHWRWCDQLARDFPAVWVEPAPIFVRDGQMWTSAGVTAGMDLALALVEADHGRALALAVARELVMFLRRPGGQGQFSAVLAAQVREQAEDGGAERWGELHAWIAEHLASPLTVERLAARVHLSPRQFTRVFAHRFGNSPAKRVEELRVEAARRRLEEAGGTAAEPPTVVAVAASCGFGSPETMRRAFRRVLGVAPADYRARFAPLLMAPAPPRSVPRRRSVRPPPR